jgi:hypothetical protein
MDSSDSEQAKQYVIARYSLVFATTIHMAISYHHSNLIIEYKFTFLKPYLKER